MFINRQIGYCSAESGMRGRFVRATAIAFARQGAKVMIGNRNVEAGEAVVKAIKEDGGEASFLKTDVSV